jgi:hypothetical protein
MSEGLVSTYADLVALLQRDHVNFRTDPERSSVFIPTTGKDFDAVLVIRWQGGDLVQVIQPLPIEIPADRVGAMERATCRLNHALPWPGLDLSAPRIAYRLVLPIAPRAGLSPDEIQSGFRWAVRAAVRLTPTLRKVLAGELAPENVVEDLRAPAAPAAPPTPPAGPASPFSID